MVETALEPGSGYIDSTDRPTIEGTLIFEGVFKMRTKFRKTVYIKTIIITFIERRNEKSSNHIAKTSTVDCFLQILNDSAQSEKKKGFWRKLLPSRPDSPPTTTTSPTTSP